MDHAIGIRVGGKGKGTVQIRAGTWDGKVRLTMATVHDSQNIVCGAMGPTEARMLACALADLADYLDRAEDTA